MAEKVVIIGSGPAGWTAAIYAARANLQPLLFEGAWTEKNRHQGTNPGGQLYLTTEVENFPTWPHVDSEVLVQFSKSALPADRFAQTLQHFYTGKRALQGKRAPIGPEQIEYVRQQAINFGTRVVGQDIARVDFKRHPFVLTPLNDEGKEQPPVEALTVIIATGARANWLGLPSEDRFKPAGVSACAVCDGAIPRYKNKPIVVVGGGDTAVEEANYLAKFGSEIHLVHRRDALRASRIMQDRAFANPKMKFHWNRVVDEVLGNDEAGVTGVRLKSTVDSATEEIPCTGMFVAIGHTPNTEFLKGQIELKPNGYIRWTTPARTNTNVEGVFAAGDVADDYYKQAVTAAGTGCMAALDAERWLAHHGHV